MEQPVLERTLADMVTGHQRLFARINRPDGACPPRAARRRACMAVTRYVLGIGAGIVSFERPKPVDEVLNDWSADVDSLLQLVERADHLISKERQVHA